MSDRDLYDVNHSLAVDSAHEPAQEHDPDRPRDTHPTHVWATEQRWQECSRCGTRDYWPAAEQRCQLSMQRLGRLGLSEALRALAADLIAFAAWWREGGHPTELPTLDEWFANFMEWRRK